VWRNGGDRRELLVGDAPTTGCAGMSRFAGRALAVAA